MTTEPTTPKPYNRRTITPMTKWERVEAGFYIIQGALYTTVRLVHHNHTLYDALFHSERPWELSAQYKNGTPVVIGTFVTKREAQDWWRENHPTVPVSKIARGEVDPLKY